MRGSLRVLAHGELRTLLAAALASNLGTFVQDVGEAWLMVRLGGTPLQIALVSATGWFPAIVLTLPAGVLADQGDRRVVLLFAQGWMALTALALSLAAFLGRVTPFWLLAATTSLGVGQALHGPSWSTYLPDTGRRAAIWPTPSPCSRSPGTSHGPSAPPSAACSCPRSGPR